MRALNSNVGPLHEGRKKKKKASTLLNMLCLILLDLKELILL